MTERQRLSNRRPCSSMVFRHNGSPHNLTVGLYADGKVGETFIDGPRIGSEIAHLVYDVAVLISIAVQYQVPVEVMRGAVDRTEVTGSAHSIAGRVLDILAKEGGR